VLAAQASHLEELARYIAAWIAASSVRGPVIRATGLLFLISAPGVNLRGTRVRKRRRRQGLSAASFVNRGAGCFCNRPVNSGGATVFEMAWSRSRDSARR
jgi:hypothetical protein